MDVALNAVWAAGLSVDGATEIWRQLQPLQGPNGETRGAVRQLPEDRPPHGLPQRVLRSPPASGLFLSTTRRFSGGFLCTYVDLSFWNPFQAHKWKRVKHMVILQQQGSNPCLIHVGTAVCVCVFAQRCEYVLDFLGIILLSLTGRGQLWFCSSFSIYSNLFLILLNKSNLICDIWCSPIENWGVNNNWWSVCAFCRTTTWWSFAQQKWTSRLGGYFTSLCGLWESFTCRGQPSKTKTLWGPSEWLSKIIITKSTFETYKNPRRTCRRLFIFNS